MQLSQLLKLYKLTAQQLQALLGRHLEVPNLRLVREAPAEWEAVVRRELGVPSLAAVAQELLLNTPVAGSTQGTSTSQITDFSGLSQIEVVDKYIEPPDQLSAASILAGPSAAMKGKPTQESRTGRRPSGQHSPNPQLVKIGRLVEVVDNRYGRICQVKSTEKLHLPGPAIDRKFLTRDTWLFFADQPNKKNPALTDIYWAAPLETDARLLSRALALAADEVLSTLLTSTLPVSVCEAVAAELLGRLISAADADMLLVTVQTVDMVQVRCPTVDPAAVAAVVERAAPEYQWNLWLRYCSPLAAGPAAGRLAALLAEAPAATVAWWPSAKQTGIAGLCLAYVAHEPAAEPASQWLQLRQALGPEQQITYHEALQTWVQQAGELSDPADYLRYQWALDTTTGDRQALRTLLAAQLIPGSVLDAWLAGAELPFPTTVALERFATLPGPAQCKIVGQLTDEQLWLVARYLAPDCTELVQQRAWLVAQQAVMAAWPAFALDLESDQVTVCEIAWGRPDAWHTGTDEARVTEVLAGLSAHVAGGTYMAIGHNLRDFDAPILARQQVKLSTENLWDTLLVELALSPGLFTYALRTVHTALADAKLAWQLFENQLWRLLLADACDWELLRQLFPTVIGEKLSVLRTRLDGANWLAANISLAQLQAQVLGWLRPQAPPPALREQVREALADDTLHATQLVLAASGEWGTLAQVPGLRFYSRLAAETEYQELDEAAVWQQVAQHPAEAVGAARFFAYCRQVGVVPTAAAMPPVLRLRLQELVVLADCRVASAPTDWQQPGSICLTPEHLLAEAAYLSPEADLGLLLVEPDLLTLHNKKLLRDKLTISDLLASESSRTEWLKFSGGQSFVALTREQAASLRAESPVGYERFWLEKRRYGSFRVWGSFDWRAVLSRLGSLPKREVRSQELPFAAGQLRSLAVDAARLQQRLGITPFHPESIYRARYWLLQAELVDSISRRGPVGPLVLLAARPEERRQLARYFERRGYYVPALDAPLARQLELLHDSRRERRLLVATLAQGSTLLQANYRGPVELLLDGFALGENYFLTQGTPLFWQAYELSGGQSQPASPAPTFELEQTDEQLSPSDMDDEEPEPSATGSTATTYEYLTRDTQFLLHLHLPLVRRWQAQARANHAASRVWLLDPRLSEAPGLAAAWGMQAELLDAPWSSLEEYQLAAQLAEEVLGGTRPDTDWQLNVEEAKELLKQVFLRFPEGEQGALVQHEWRDEQLPYLHKILPAPANMSLLVSLPTGGGKSLLFQGPALYRSAYSNRLSIVVTPLKALMEDQVAGLWQRGFYSSVDYLNQDKQDEVQQIYSRLAGGELMLLFITPERFRSRGFARAFAQRLAADGGLEYAVFDEAHCISQWGHEFRPDYLHAARTVQGHRAASTRQFPVLLFSATVTEKIYDGFTTLFT